MFKLAYAALRARLLPVILVVFALTASMVLLISVDRIQAAVKTGFNQSISGVDLIIGPRSGNIELVLYTVFHLGRPTNNITMETLEDLSTRAEVDWLLPIALGDSHRGYRVVATTSDYFKHIQHGANQPLEFDAGQSFKDINQVVIGHSVAEQFDYELGTELSLTHGSSEQLGQEHDDLRFKVSGILQRTGTPIDQAVYVDLKGYELIHLGWKTGRRLFSADSLDIQSLPEDALKPATVTAAYMGLKSKLSLFRFSREVANYPNEAISAVVPGVALSELWSIVGMIDRVFGFLSWMVIGISIVSMVTMTITSLDTRTREMTILRANGASPLYLAGLVMVEALFIGLSAIVSALVIVTGATLFAKDYLILELGIDPAIQILTHAELQTFGLILVAGLLSSLVPALMVYKRTLQSGLLR